MSEANCENMLLTVTVPAYNAEGFLRDCLDSLCIPEVLDELEVLVINDGSTDGTAQIAEEYEKRFPKTVRLISKENGGHGSGINCGIANASGLYFKVVDADDWVERGGFRKLMGTLKELNKERAEGQEEINCREKNDDRQREASDRQDRNGNCQEQGSDDRKIPDIVCSNFYWVYEKQGIPKEEFERETELAEPFAGVRYEKTYWFDDIADRLYIKMHNMTIRTEILKNMSGIGEAEVNLTGRPLRMDEHCFYVDTEYVTYPIPYVETIYFLKEYAYNYRIGRQGQSVGMERMRRNERDYDRVLGSLLSFYDRLEEKCNLDHGGEGDDRGTKNSLSDSATYGVRKKAGGPQVVSPKTEDVFWNGLDEKKISCSAEKRRYIANMIARVIAAKIKIMLSFPASAEKKRELVAFDQKLQTQYPEIYRSNINGAVKALRASGYLLYRPAAWMVKKKYSD